MVLVHTCACLGSEVQYRNIETFIHTEHVSSWCSPVHLSGILSKASGAQLFGRLTEYVGQPRAGPGHVMASRAMSGMARTLACRIFLRHAVG